MKKKVNVFGKEFSVLLIALVVVGIASAALLSYFGVITGNAVVNQSVTVEDSPITGNWSMDLVAGETITDCDDEGDGYSVKNNADVPVNIQFETNCSNTIGQDDGTKTSTSIDWNNECKGIDTEIYGTLKLTTKDVKFGESPWTETDDAKATVNYTIVGDSFSAEVVEGSKDNYELVYYSDNFERFDNPAKAVKIDPINESLPYSDDANLDEYYYCGTDTSGNNTGEDYKHCHGAKLWYVPGGALDSCVERVCDINWSQASSFLFETDLISYTDTADDKITLPANGGGFNFCVEQDFALNLAPDTYTIETEIQPA